VGLRDWLKFQKDMISYAFKGMMNDSASFAKRLTTEQQVTALAESLRLDEALITLLLFRVFLPGMWYFQVFMGVAVIFRIWQLSKLLSKLRLEDRERLKRVEAPDE
jgi:hypothetical protein